MILTAPSVAQVVIGAPGLALGFGVMVNVLVAVTNPVQGDNAFTVSVKVTLPFDLSAALGLYVQVVNEVGLVKLPVPFDVHNTET